MALKSVGVRLVVEGLGNFKSSMSSAGSSLAEVSTELENIAPQARQAGLAIGAMGAAIDAGLGFAVFKAADFEQAITNAVSVTGYMGDEAEVAKEKMGELARELGSKTAFTATEVANAMYDLASKGFKPAEMAISDLQPFLDLAAATQADLAMTTETVTSTLRAFGLSTSESGRVADVFAKTIGSSAATIDKLSTSMAYVAPVSKAAGMSLEETSAFLGALYNTGLDASMAGTALRGVLAELMSPSNDLTSVLDRLGLSLDDVDLASNSVTDILGKLKDAGISNQEVMDVFGKRAGPAALSLLGVNEAGISTIDTIKDLTTTLEGAGGTAKNMAEMQLDTTKGKLTILKSAFEDLIITVGDVLLPIITSLGSTIKSILVPLGEWAKKHPKLTKILVIGAAAIGTIATALGVLLGAVGLIVPAIASFKTALIGLKAASLALTGAAGPIGLIILAITALVTVTLLIIKYWKPISNFFKKVWDNIYKFVKKAADKIWKFLKKWGKLILGIIFPVAGIAMIIYKWRDKILSYLKKVLDKIVNFFKDLWDDVEDVLENILDWFKDLHRNISNAIRNVAKRILEPFEDAWDWISDIFEEIIDWFADLADNIWDFYSDIWDAIITPFEDAWDWISDIFSDIIDWFSDLPNRIWDFYAGIWDAISAPFIKAWDWISEKVFSPIREWFKSLPDKIWDFYSGIWKAVSAPFEKAWNWVSDNVFSPIRGWFRDLPEKIWDYFLDIWHAITAPFERAWTWLSDHFFPWVRSWFRDLPDKLWGYFSDIWHAIAAPFERAYKWVYDNFMTPIVEFFEELDDVGGWLSLLGKLNPINWRLFEHGGTMQQSGMAIVGEAGPELLSLPAGATVTPLGNNTTYNITENYARPESSQSLDLTLQALAMLVRT